jgi:hypothetical protein
VTLLRDLIDIPTSVGEADFVVRASGDADLARYVVTDDLRRNFGEALGMIGHAVTTGRSQARFLHGSFGSGKSHFMAVLREVLRHNPQARAVRGLAEPVAGADGWLAGQRVLVLSLHMLDARSVEHAVLSAYYHQVTAAHPDRPAPAVHRSDALLADAEKIRASMGDDAFFAALRGSGGTPGAGAGLAAHRARAAGWTRETYAAAAADPPGTPGRDRLVGALTGTYFSGAVLSGEYLDLDTGLQVITRHASDLGYHALVLFLDEFILWLVTKIADHTFVQTEGVKLNKLVEADDTTRLIPIASFVARQRNLEEFLGPRVGGTERAAMADLMRSVQGRLGNIVLADTNLPEITEKRLLRPVDDRACTVIDRAFAAVRGNHQVWEILLLGAQYGDAGIGSDATAFRRLYPFSPALVATLVALSQALQRERTALRIMTELLVERRETLRVNDLIGVAALFDPLVLRGELPDELKLRQQFQTARETYRRKLRPLLLSTHGITEQQAAGHEAFQLDDNLIRTLILGALVPEVPALQHLTAAKLHALNFGSITAPVRGYENQVVLDRLRRLSRDAGELHLSDGPDPVISLNLSTIDFDQLLDLVPHHETTAGVLQQLIRDLVAAELGLGSQQGTFGELVYQREWRGRRHPIQVRFGNIGDAGTTPTAVLLGNGGGNGWRVVIDYPFDGPPRTRRDDIVRIQELPRGSQTAFWVPLHLTDEMMRRVTQLARVNYLLGSGGTGDRLQTLAADWSAADRQQGKVYLQQRQAQLRQSLLEALKQAYGVVKPQPSDVEEDSDRVLHALADGLHLGDPHGGGLGAAFANLTGELLAWAYPGTPALPDDERPPTRAELNKILSYAARAAADPARGIVVDQADRRTVGRICDPLKLGRLEEHRYVLASSTCWWSQHLVQAAAGLGYTGNFPVPVLRELLDQPERRGFDRDLQNLVIAVFALERQLAWYKHGTKVPVDSVLAVDNELELRPPPMPDEQAFAGAARRGQLIFGTQLPEWRNPANLAEMARALRGAATSGAAAAVELVRALERHAGVLGLDPSATTGRLATARRVAALAELVAAERDDVVLVEQVARADLGEIDDKAAGVSLAQAARVTDALAGVQWPLLDAVDDLAETDERAQVVLEKLRYVAGHEQQAADLVTALREAVDVGAALLVRARREPGAVPVPVQGMVAPVPPPVPGGGGRVTGTRTVAGVAEWEQVAAEIRGHVNAGRRVTVSWEVA